MRAAHPRILALVLLLASIPGMAAETLTGEKRADIVRLLELTGAMSMGKQMAGHAAAQMVQAVKKLRPDIPQDALRLVPQEVETVFEESAPAFVELIVPIYHKHFTAAEIKGMIRFYSTDLGRKMIQSTPAIMNESMQLGQQWGQSLGPVVGQRVKNRLIREGIEF